MRLEQTFAVRTYLRERKSTHRRVWIDGVIMRAMFGIGKPRALQGVTAAIAGSLRSFHGRCDLDDVSPVAIADLDDCTR